mmetsp:Transcript_19514/g.43161  ORF Transcript_19514/g.43161 Transcript_19514/m.43161 type:complete len:86 (+) Transcript_19514:401-658(+)
MNVDEKHIFVIGRSIGTGIAVNLCTKRKPGAVILISPFTCIADIAKNIVGALSILVKDSFNSLERCHMITCPCLIMHGIFDELIP